jgi:hypothetical protein
LLRVKNPQGGGRVPTADEIQSTDFGCAFRRSERGDLLEAGEALSIFAPTSEFGAGYASPAKWTATDIETLLEIVGDEIVEAGAR